MKKEGEADVSEFLAKRITMRFIRKFQIKEEDWDLYYLGIEVIVTTALTSLMIMALGIALRNFFGSVVFLLCFMSIRGYCGGYHAKTRVRCFFVSILCYLLSFGMMNPWGDEGTKQNHVLCDARGLVSGLFCVRICRNIWDINADMGNNRHYCFTSLCKKEEKEMNKFKATLSRLIMAAVWGVAITTLTSTSRYLTYQPKGEEELMRRYL